MSDQKCGTPDVYVSRHWHAWGCSHGLTGVQTVEALPKGHLSQNIEHAHLVPLRHIQAFAIRTRLLSHDIDELVDNPRDKFLLFQQSALRESRAQHLAHRRMFLWVALAANTFAVESGGENRVEGSLSGNRPAA